MGDAEEIEIDRRMFFVVTLLSLATISQDDFLFSTVSGVGAGLIPFICALTYGIVQLGYAFAARFRRSMFPVRKISAIVTLPALFGGALWHGIAGGTIDPRLAILANILVACCRAWALTLSALAFSHRGGKGTVLVTVSCGIAASYFIEVLAPAFFRSFAPATYALAGPIALAFVVPVVESARQEYRRDAAPRDLAATNPSSFPGLQSHLYICVIVFELTFGVFQSLSSSSVDMAIAAACGLIIIVLIYLCARLWPSNLLDRSYSLAAALLMATLMLLLYGTPAALGLADVTGILAPQLFRAVTWAILTEIARHNRAGAFSAISRGFGLSALCSALGFLLREMIVSGGQVFILVLALAFFLYLWIGMRDFSFERRISEVFDVRPVTVPAELEAGAAEDEGETAEAGGSATVEAGRAAASSEAEALEHSKVLAERRLRDFAADHKLTPRETDVFVLLAQGRDVAHIEGALYITRNTVKTHVRHIYEKLGVHTQQELIDLVA